MLRLTTIVALLVAAGLATAAPGASPSFPTVIRLPAGFQPEGIEIRGSTFFVGSIPTGAIYRGSLRTGAGAVLIQGASGRSAIGVDTDDRSRLFVAGGQTGMAFVYNVRTRALLRSYQLATAPTFVNDVVVTRNGVYFTDSQKPVLYRVPLAANAAVRTIQLTGDYVHGTGFNLNGIDATPNGRTLFVVQSSTGKLFRVDPATGVTREVTLAGGESVPNGDGLLLDGRTLYVVQNRLNRIAVVALAADLASGRVVTRLASGRFDVPTTVDDFGRRLYAVNARFGTASPDTAAYQVVQLRKPRGR